MLGRRKLETEFCSNCLQGFGSLFLEMQKQPNEKSHQHDEAATTHDCEQYSFHCYTFLLVAFRYRMKMAIHTRALLSVACFTVGYMA